MQPLNATAADAGLSVHGINAGVSASAGRRLLWILRLLAGASVILHLSLMLRADTDVLLRPFIDDTFYSLSVSRSLAAGTGISVDGQHPTNGVQPLICFLNAPLFMISGGDDYLALRLALLLQILIYVLASMALGKFMATSARRSRDRPVIYWLTVCAILINLSLARFFLNGLETGLAVLMLFGSASMYSAKIAGTSSLELRWCLLLGAILGLGVLARIDIAIFVASVVFVHSIRGYRRNRSEGGGKRGLFRTAIFQSFIIGLVSLAVSAPWWHYNIRTFGSLMPISGYAQQFLLRQRLPGNIWSTVQTVSDSMTLFLHTPLRFTFGWESVAGFMLAIVAGIAWYAIPSVPGVCRDARSRWRGLWDYTGALPLAVFILAITVYYVFAFGAPHFIPRYLLSLRLMILLGILSLLYAVKLFSASRSAARYGLLLLSSCWVLASLGMSARNFTGSYEGSFAAMGDWVGRHVQPGQHIGMFQSGLVGFMHADRVVNLDGKVNAEALHALQTRSTAAYVDSARLEYLADWQQLLDEGVFYEPSVRSGYARYDSVGSFIIWKRIPH